MIRYLRNLSLHQALSGDEVLPWDWEPSSPIPQRVKGDKKARFTWITNPDTDHYVYSLAEGVNPNCRIIADKQGDSSNPLQTLYGLAVDYDAPLQDHEIQAGLARVLRTPNYIERTLSGYVRLVYLFASPLNLPGEHAAREFYRVCMDKLKLKLFGPGFDEPAFLEPGKYYTNSANWMVVDESARLEETLVRGWWLDASKKVAWDRVVTGPNVPIEVAAEALAAKYPKFAQWPGEFVVGAQGPTFWIEGSESPKSASVHETGVYTFAAHAPKPFYSWADLLGAAFVDEYRTKQQATATEGVYFDGQAYWVKSLDGRWQWWNQNNLLNYLQVVRKVSSRKDKSTQLSELDETLNHVHMHQRVDSATPFVFYPPGIITRGNKKLLNVSNVRPLMPVPEMAKWGPDGRFPWLSQFFDTLFTTPIQKEIFLAWLTRAYKGAINQRPTQGQVVVVMGGVRVGKTLLSSGIMSRLFGGHADASCFITGKDNFGGELFEVGVWAIDDNSYVNTAQDGRRLAEKLKALAANSHHRYNQKFEKGGMTDWMGRALVTANCDEVSVQQIPVTDVSNSDKLMLFRAVETSKMDFLTDSWALGEILDKEMPFFAAWLRDNVIRPELMGDSRFGLKHYHEPSVVEASHQASPANSFYEIMHDWMLDWAEAHPDKTHWVGTSTQLQKSILMDETAAAAMRPYSSVHIGRILASLNRSNRHAVEFCPVHGMRQWKIEVPEDIRKLVASKKQLKGFTRGGA